jgi:hypothetical protein
VFELANGGTTDPGTPSYMADLSAYYSEIYLPVPEPATLPVFACGLYLLRVAAQRFRKP